MRARLIAWSLAVPVLVLATLAAVGLTHVRGTPPTVQAR